MANVDVSELMHDPDFIDPMSVITRTPVVNGKGENVIKSFPNISFGSVQPATGDALSRIPEALRSTDMKSFWFKGRIITTEPGKYSSVIVFKGQRYQVKSVFDWTNWGAGWTEGLCVGEKPA